MHFALVKEPKSLKKQLLVEKTWLFVIHAENITIIQGIRQWQGERSVYPNKEYFLPLITVNHDLFALKKFDIGA